MTQSVYVSKRKEWDAPLFASLLKTLQAYDVKFQEHVGGSYLSQKLLNSDKLILIGENYDSKEETFMLGKGQYTEFLKFARNIPVKSDIRNFILIYGKDKKFYTLKSDDTDDIVENLGIDWVEAYGTVKAHRIIKGFPLVHHLYLDRRNHPKGTNVTFMDLDDVPNVEMLEGLTDEPDNMPYISCITLIRK